MFAGMLTYKVKGFILNQKSNTGLYGKMYKILIPRNYIVHGIKAA
jgi:hypothetical protein